MHRNRQRFLLSNTTQFCSEFSRNHSSSTQTFFGELPSMLKMAMELHKGGGGEKKKKENSKKSLTHPLLFTGFWSREWNAVKLKLTALFSDL